MQADRSAARRLDDLARRAADSGLPQFTAFLTPAEQAQAEISARAEGVGCFAGGGAEQAERRIIAFGDEPPDAFPIACIRIDWPQQDAAPSHRDLLGSVLGLGIDRDQVGDIFVMERSAYLLCTERMADFIAASLSRVGRTHVHAARPDQWPKLQDTGGSEVNATVSSLRLDAVLAAALRLSRGKAAQLVASGRVLVDHRQTLNADTKLHEGAVLSVRGEGRITLHAIGGTTKKGRTSVTLLRR